VKNKTIELDKLKKDVNLFLEALKKEGIETKSMSKLLTTCVIERRPLTDEEGKKFANQLKNLVKTVGLATIILMPGGSIFFILIHYLKLRDYFLSDSFSYLKNKDI
jgi:hypothetical protein